MSDQITLQLLDSPCSFVSQLFIATCSPARDASAGYTAWGHSTLVGPVSQIRSHLNSLPWSRWHFLGIWMSFHAIILRYLSNVNMFLFPFSSQFGEVIATTEHEEAIIVEEIDYSLIELRR